MADVRLTYQLLQVLVFVFEKKLGILYGTVATKEAREVDEIKMKSIELLHRQTNRLVILEYARRQASRLYGTSSNSGIF
jgi:hypothetical protein